MQCDDLHKAISVNSQMFQDFKSASKNILDENKKKMNDLVLMYQNLHSLLQKLKGNENLGVDTFYLMYFMMFSLHLDIVKK